MMRLRSFRAFLDASPFLFAVVIAACGGTITNGEGGSTTTTSAPPPNARPAVSYMSWWGGTGGTWGGGGSGWGGAGGAVTTTWGGGAGDTGWGGAGGAVTTTWGGGAGDTGWGGAGTGWGGTGGYDGCTDGCGSSPELTLTFGDPSLTCNELYPWVSCGGHSNVSITLPAELQHVGTFSLSTPGLYAYFQESGASYAGDPSSCPFGGGSFTEGTLTIQALSSAQVVFSLAGTQPFLLGAPSADGTYVAPRCY